MIRPLDPLNDISPIAKLLKSAPAEEAHQEITRLSSLDLDPVKTAARAFAKGALAQREGALDAAKTNLTEATELYEKLGDTRAEKLSRCEAQLAVVRRGPRSVYHDAIGVFDSIKQGAEGDVLVEVMATHYRGATERLLGDAAATQRSLLWALERSEPFLDERAKILNSLGTLYVVIGAHGAAQSLLEHAAELHHQNGDTIGEAIAFGQLGSAALALGDLERARRHLQRQEWLCSRVGDVFGQARSLIFLADVAINLGRPDDAIALASRARDLASAAKPPLRLWIAYATRALGRARMDVGDAHAKGDLEAAATLFGEVGNPLGAALTEWDRARLGARSSAPKEEGAVPSGSVFFGPAWQLAALGLAGRVAEVLRDERTYRTTSPAGRVSEQAIAAAAQGIAHLTVAHEVDLLYGAPEELGRIAERKTSASRNLARMSALCLAPPGLFIVVLATGTSQKPALPPERSAAVAIADLPGLVVWVWRTSTALVEVARDLASLKVSLGGEARGALVRCLEARVIAAPLAGEVAPTLETPDLGGLVAAALAAPPGTLDISSELEWDAEAEARLVMAGFSTRRREALGST